ncbi:hypothetical protein ACP70R_031013 [Stipagrostis hirtigluma subsp. patula]
MKDRVAAVVEPLNGAGHCELGEDKEQQYVSNQQDERLSARSTQPVQACSCY